MTTLQPALARGSGMSPIARLRGSDRRTQSPVRAALLARMPVGQDVATWLAYWGLEERKGTR
jgi:hypothetical protein